MASYAHTFVSGETVTPTKLNNARTVSNIVNADISSGADIALSKLATGALPTAITVASANIVDGTIVNADISASAAIAGTKIAPNFGNQVVIAAPGSAAAPGFTFNGDTNTGFCRPGTDSIALCVAGVERMRLDSSGNVMVGTSARVNAADGTTAEGITFYASDSLHVSNAGAVAGFFRRTASNGNILAFYRASTSAVGTISVSTTATAYNTTSDYRLKENPTPLAGGLATVDELKPCEFTWKSDGSIGRGFIAHELQAVVPEAVNGEKDALDAEGNPEYQGVDAAKLVPYLVSAVQELKARVEALEAA